MNTAGGNEIHGEIIRCEKALEASRTLLDGGLLEDALSRSYYAVLHAARAALQSKDIAVSSHEAAKRLFGLHLVKTGEMDRRYGVILRQEQDDRLLADYDVSFEAERSRVEQRVRDASEFAEAVKEYLRHIGHHEC